MQIKLDINAKNSNAALLSSAKNAATARKERKSRGRPDTRPPTRAGKSRRTPRPPGPFPLPPGARRTRLRGKKRYPSLLRFCTLFPMPLPDNLPVPEREASIDLMRMLGLALIFLAHAGLPASSAVFQFRTFDVPVMVFVSALAYSRRDIGNAGRFLLRRTLRLLLPLYVFLLLYFLVSFPFAARGLAKPWQWTQILRTFALSGQGSIGFVWIFRVFLLMALASPVLVPLERRLRHDGAFLAVFVLLLALQTGLAAALRPLHPGWAAEDWLLYPAGYAAVFFLGLRMRQLTGKRALAVTGAVSVLFLLAAIPVARERGTLFCFQSFKYPPMPYFLLWGSLASCLLWTARKFWTPFLDWRWARFAGHHTNWIYLWHIPFACQLARCHAITPWPVRFAMLFLLPLALFALQRAVLLAWQGKRSSAFLRHFTA